jgi:RHS repeat-associated protein
LQSAEYFYDGDGNMVKAVVNDVVTYYPGRHYNEEVDNSVSTVKKFYTMGSTTVAVRTVSGTEDVLNWVLGDHYGAQRSTPVAQRRGPGSASITANDNGSWNSEIEYCEASPKQSAGDTAFGEVRASSGLTPTEYRYTGRLAAAELGLYYYVARWYDPYLTHMLSPDSIIPDPVTPLDWDRYSYSRNNPIRYTDPSGHRVEEDAGYVAPYIRLISTNGCNYTERIVFENAARDVGAAYAREYNQTYGRIAKKMGDDFVPLSAEEAFLLVHDGPVFVERQSYDCSEGCWGRAVSQNKIYIYNNASTKNLVDYPKLLVHELGHVFENTLAQNGLPKLRWSLPSDMWNREGFKPRYQGWQFGGDDTNGEIFADMFVHWTYGEWARGISGALTASAAQKAGFMRDHMASSILSAFH